MTKKELATYGELMFGPRYQPKLAAILTHYRGKKIDQSQISRWVLGPDGYRDPPSWIDDLVVRASIQMKHELRARAEQLDNLNRYRLSEEQEEWMSKGQSNLPRNDDYVDPDATVDLPPNPKGPARPASSATRRSHP